MPRTLTLLLLTFAFVAGLGAHVWAQARFAEVCRGANTTSTPADGGAGALSSEGRWEQKLHQRTR
jgi:hypothetical protein